MQLRLWNASKQAQWIFKKACTSRRLYRGILVSLRSAEIFVSVIKPSHTILFHLSTPIHHGLTNLALLALSGDVESNPGPTGKLIFGTFNASGCKEYSKLKRITSWLYKLAKGDRFIFSLQETHVGGNDIKIAQSLWRSGLLVSPSLNRARGVLTFYSNCLFDKVIYENGTQDGRSTWIVGLQGNCIEMFVSIYSPNSGKNAEFYTSFFKKVNNLAQQYSVDNIFICGDFNLELDHNKGGTRKQTKYEEKLSKLVNFELKSLNLSNLLHVNKNRPTWNRSNKFSTLDYVFGPKHIADSKPNENIKWGIDHSDHAMIYVEAKFDLEKGPGMFRPNLSFLDCTELRPLFEAELFLQMFNMPTSWDPHMKLEFCKVMIRTKVAEFSLKHKKMIDDRHRNIIDELTRIKNIKSKLLEDKSYNLHKYLTVEVVDKDIDSLEIKLDHVLVERTKILANKSRIKWLEFGEKSNKYFMNLNKSFQNKAYFKSFFQDGKEVFSLDKKLDTVYSFYTNLYSYQKANDPLELLDRVSINEIKDFDRTLDNKLDKSELLKVLKQCGDTASGPDGISYKLIKVCWSFYAELLINSWNYGVQTGCLASSHRESVICLLPKKGKDPRHVNNLRPISLSNCDIKIITKALARRINKLLSQSLSPHQTAYIPGRLVHDNLRAIEIIRDYCSDNNVEGYLVSLDAKKAFDSVDHSFIENVLRKFRVSSSFIDIFRLLYNKINSRIQINGHFTKAFPIERSVKQGDALSCSLFIMCMEIIINLIEQSNCIKRLKIEDCLIPKVFAYADDVALVATNILDIKKGLEIYNEFSKHSGLYLNIDKTEVLCLDRRRHPVEFNVEGADGDTKIRTSDSLTICGRTYSISANDEFRYNVQDKIHKLEIALESWRRRPLSIFGRNLVLKTFGLSQIIYSMQNHYFDPQSLKMVERICFNFLWNKKINKTKAFERIARVKLKLPLHAGAISAVDADKLDLALKLKQVLRSTESEINHAIKELQITVQKYKPSLIFQELNSSSKFIRRAKEASNLLGSILTDEIIKENPDKLLHKDYYNLIASENLSIFVKHIKLSPIIKNNIIQVASRFRLKYVGQLINELKFLSTDVFKAQLANIKNHGGDILLKLLHRKELTYGLTFRDGFFLITNKRIHSKQFTTKLIKNRLMFTDNELPALKEFVLLKKIIHPKEREICFFRLHEAILSNDKLFMMKLIDSPTCQVCKKMQTAEHFFTECSNSSLAESVLSNHTEILNNYTLRINIDALIQRLLFLNKDKKLSSDFIQLVVCNRISDFDKLFSNKTNKKKLTEINQLSLMNG